jgi:stearoyl-CoA desaturase (delta-9 desaturase)
MLNLTKFKSFFKDISTRNNLYLRLTYYIFVHYLALLAFKYGTITTIFVAISFWFIGAFAVSGYAHRALAHGSVKFKSKTLEHLSNIFAIYSGIGTPLGWAALHRMHHSYLDTDKDPHSPWRIGFWRSYFHLWDWRKEDVPPKMTAGLHRNTIALRYHFKAVQTLILFWVSLFVFSELAKVHLGILGGLPVITGAAIAVVFGIHGMGITNAVSHSGEKPKDIVSLDPIGGAFINFGEGQHEYHHYKPMDYSFGGGISDPTARVLELAEKLNLVQINRTLTSELNG